MTSEKQIKNKFLKSVLTFVKDKIEDQLSSDELPNPHSPTSQPSHPSNSPSQNDLAQSFNAMSLSATPTRPTNSVSGESPGFVGGFASPSPSYGATPYNRPASLTPGQNSSSPYNYSPGLGIQSSPEPLSSYPVPSQELQGSWPRPSSQQAPVMPIPYEHRQQSLTMQHALSPYPLDAPSISAPALSQRPHSTSGISESLSTPIPSPDSPAPRPANAGLKVKRPRASSDPPSPSTSSAAGGDAMQCDGVTKAGKRCTRIVKSGPALSGLDPDAQIERFCHQHSKEVMGSTGFYSKTDSHEWIKFEDWIPAYLQQDTQVALRVQMEKARSASDVPGYIYTFEIRDPTNDKEVKLKVGRAVNLVKRIDQWGKQCGSEEQVLRGWWPGTVEDDEGTLMKGRVKAGEKGLWCHRLERLVHLELADLSVNAPYLDPDFPKIMRTESDGGGSDTPRKASTPNAVRRAQRKPCADCGQLHKEIFVFKRAERGKYRNKEWESVVRPVIERWGAFVEAHI